MHIQTVMLPVSAGDATLIVDTGSPKIGAILIDTGLKKAEALSYLKSMGVNHLSLVILSHPDMDHLGGLNAILLDDEMKVDEIWCFDLSFLKEYVRTGIIPRPRRGTRDVIYDYLFRSTFGEFHECLIKAGKNNIKVRQVSEGHKLCKGSLLLEVLYPHDDLYNAIRDPRALKKLLGRRSQPDSWELKKRQKRLRLDLEESKPESQPLAVDITTGEEIGQPLEMPKVPENFEGTIPIASIEDNQQYDTDEYHQEIFDEAYNDDLNSNLSEEKVEIPWKMIGSLYNNLSIVVKVSVLGGLSSPTMLFPGDLTDWTTIITRQKHNLKSDILKMPHHGSNKITLNLERVRRLTRECDYCGEYHWWRMGEPCPHFNHQSHVSLVKAIGASSSTGFDSVSMLSSLVDPRYILLFPYPSQNLPNANFNVIGSILLVNREKKKSASLANRNNEARPVELKIGLERQEIIMEP